MIYHRVIAPDSVDYTVQSLYNAIFGFYRNAIFGVHRNAIFGVHRNAIFGVHRNAIFWVHRNVKRVAKEQFYREIIGK